VPRYVGNGKIELLVEIGLDAFRDPQPVQVSKQKCDNGGTFVLYKQDAPQRSARTEGGSSSVQECLPRSRRRSRVVSWSAQLPETMLQGD